LNGKLPSLQVSFSFTTSFESPVSRFQQDQWRRKTNQLEKQDWQQQKLFHGTAAAS
jgi:hypothetical protein